MGAECPYCEFEAADVQEEVAHMNNAHPEIVEQRLEAAGFVPDGSGGWIDPLAAND